MECGNKVSVPMTQRHIAPLYFFPTVLDLARGSGEGCHTNPLNVS